ncbi:MAG TPA: MauE/DoxX family redox-associated membrane protein, partial [Natronosporangium sp.]
ISTVIGAALPFVELALGGLLLVGLGVRVAAAVSTGLLVVFAAAVASAWARGLVIDCGCFGGGGELAAGTDPGYGLEIARDAALALVSAALFAWPRTKLSVDAWLVASSGISRRGDEQVS